MLTRLRGSATQDLHVVSYNVLSSSLASPSYFLNCEPQHLKAENRFDKLKRSLEKEIKERKPVICLQEVSQKWAGPLHCFFQREGYYFVSSHYTRGWQGYMGSAIAFPTDAWMADEVEVVRLADTKPWPRPLKQTNLLDRVVNFVVEGISFLGGGSKKNQKQDHFDLAKNRMNTMILMKLKNPGGKTFCIATYHMPCMFWAPKVMVIHTALAMQKVQVTEDSESDRGVKDRSMGLTNCLG